MKAHGSREFGRHFQSDSHWFKDVVYRVHMGAPVLKRLMEPMELSEEQLVEYRAKPFVELGERYPFPEELYYQPVFWFRRLTTKIRLQANHCLITWLQNEYRSLLWGDNG